jgi:hypothetical protein
MIEGPCCNTPGQHDFSHIRKLIPMASPSQHVDIAIVTRSGWDDAASWVALTEAAATENRHA